MPHPKLKREVFENTGGIDQKASRYITGAKEVLDLVNYDFQVPGAWQQRFGCTSALNGNTLTIGSSQTITAIWQITKQGVIAYDTPNTLPQNRILIGHDQGVFKYAWDDMAGVTSLYSPLVSGLTACNWNYVNYKDQTYFASVKGSSDPQRFYKYSPNTFPSGGDGVASFGQIIPFTNLTGGFSAGSPANIAGGTYFYAYALRDKFDFVGPIGGTFLISVTPSAQAIVVSGMTTGNGTYDGMSFGFKDFVVFRTGVPSYPSTQLVAIGTATGATFKDTGFFDTGYPQAIVTPPYGRFDLVYGKSPTLLEVYQNRLFINADTDLNRIEFSEVDDLQNFQPENFFLVTNQNFTVTGFKTYNQSLIFFLQQGILRLTGDNGDNFNLQTVSTEYGCISSKTIVEYKQYLWALDRTGVIQFTGSQPELISNRVEAIFQRMNFTAAQERACGVHFQERNEVWFSIPIDGATVNNIILVYDYLVNAWTTFSGDKIKPTAMNQIYRVYSATLAYRNFDQKYMYFGSIGASLLYFDPTLTSDDGTGITTSFTTLYHNELGKSRTAQFRRFYLDLNGYQGATLTFGLEFRPNYHTATSATMPLYISEYQRRVEFGIPAGSLSVKVSHGSTQAHIVNGYTIEYRYQRNT